MKDEAVNLRDYQHHKVSMVLRLLLRLRYTKAPFCGSSVQVASGIPVAAFTDYKLEEWSPAKTLHISFLMRYLFERFSWKSSLEKNYKNPSKHQIHGKSSLNTQDLQIFRSCLDAVLSAFNMASFFLV